MMKGKIPDISEWTIKCKPISSYTKGGNATDCFLSDWFGIFLMLSRKPSRVLAAAEPKSFSVRNSGLSCTLLI